MDPDGGAMGLFLLLRSIRRRRKSKMGSLGGTSRAVFNVGASQTDFVLVPASANKVVRVMKLVVVVPTAITVTFNTKGSGAGTAISCGFPFGANGGVVLPADDDSWFETNTGEALTVTNGAAITGILLKYIQN